MNTTTVITVSKLESRACGSSQLWLQLQCAHNLPAHKSLDSAWQDLGKCIAKQHSLYSTRRRGQQIVPGIYSRDQGSWGNVVSEVGENTRVRAHKLGCKPGGNLVIRMICIMNCLQAADQRFATLQFSSLNTTNVIGVCFGRSCAMITDHKKKQTRLTLDNKTVTNQNIQQG